MGFFDSIFGIDILGDGKADIFDDAIILAALEEDEDLRTAAGCDEEDAWDDEDDVIASGAIDDL